MVVSHILELIFGNFDSTGFDLHLTWQLSRSYIEYNRVKIEEEQSKKRI